MTQLNIEAKEKFLWREFHEGMKLGDVSLQSSDHYTHMGDFMASKLQVGWYQVFNAKIYTTRLCNDKEYSVRYWSKFWYIFDFEHNFFCHYWFIWNTTTQYPIGKWWSPKLIHYRVRMCNLIDGICHWKCCCTCFKNWSQLRNEHQIFQNSINIFKDTWK